MKNIPNQPISSKNAKDVIDNIVDEMSINESIRIDKTEVDLFKITQVTFTKIPDLPAPHDFKLTSEESSPNNLKTETTSHYDTNIANKTENKPRKEKTAFCSIGST